MTYHERALREVQAYRCEGLDVEQVAAFQASSRVYLVSKWQIEEGFTIEALVQWGQLSGRLMPFECFIREYVRQRWVMLADSN